MDDKKVERRRKGIERADQLALGFVSGLWSSLWTQLWLTLSFSFFSFSLFFFLSLFSRAYLRNTSSFRPSASSLPVFLPSSCGFVKSRNEYPWLLYLIRSILSCFFSLFRLLFLSSFFSSLYSVFLCRISRKSLSPFIYFQLLRFYRFPTEIPQQLF